MLPLSDPVSSFEALKALSNALEAFWPAHLRATSLQIASLAHGKMAAYFAKVPKCFLDSLKKFIFSAEMHSLLPQVIQLLRMIQCNSG